MSTPIIEVINLIEQVEKVWINSKNVEFKKGYLSALLNIKQELNIEFVSFERDVIIEAYHEGKRNAGVHSINESLRYYEKIIKSTY